VRTWSGANAQPGQVILGRVTNPGGDANSTPYAGTGTLLGAAASNARRIAHEGEITIMGVPSTAYIRASQQVLPQRNNGTDIAVAAQDRISNAIMDSHERDFSDSLTGRTYLLPLPTPRPAGTAARTAHFLGQPSRLHNTDWANTLPGAANPNPDYVPGRGMTNDERSFDFRIVPVSFYQHELQVSSFIEGADGDRDVARNFRVQLLNAAGDPVPNRDLQIFNGYTAVEGSDGFMTMEPSLTPVTTGVNGMIQTGLPSLYHSESFTIRGIPSGYQVVVTMLNPRSDDYDISYMYETMHSTASTDSLASPYATRRVSLLRTDASIVFTSYRENMLIPTGLATSGLTVLTAITLAGVAGLAVFTMRKRRELDDLLALGVTVGPARGKMGDIEGFGGQIASNLGTMCGRVMTSKLGRRAIKAVHTFRQLSLVALRGIWRK
jgi:hypothetical protein